MGSRNAQKSALTSLSSIAPSAATVDPKRRDNQQADAASENRHIASRLDPPPNAVEGDGR